MICDLTYIIPDLHTHISHVVSSEKARHFEDTRTAATCEQRRRKTEVPLEVTKGSCTTMRCP